MNNFVAKLMSFSLEINIYYCHEFKVCSKTIICSNKKMTFHPSQIFGGAFEYTLKRRDARGVGKH